jgi:uncharacterized protein YdeI (YjbR/CyaY-like superfamily)
MMKPAKDRIVLECSGREEWEAWLVANHDSASEIWLRFAKKGADATTVSRADALEAALCWGWIDGQAASQDDRFWLQRFTPRRKRSKWSRINREAAELLVASGKMMPAGLAAVDAAKADGRWDAAYAPPSRIEVPADLAARLAADPSAKAFFESLSSQNRYAILYRIAEAKLAETRARRIEKFMGMLARGETIH